MLLEGSENTLRNVSTEMGLRPRLSRTWLTLLAQIPASAIKTPFQSKTTSLIMIEISDCIPKDLQTWTLAWQFMAVPNIFFLEICPVRKLGKANGALRMRHEAEHSAVVAANARDIL